MKQYTLTFFINKQEFIITSLNDPFSTIDWNYTEPIYFTSYAGTIILSYIPVYFAILDLREFLNKTLHSELIIDSSIRLDIGYLYNCYYKNEKRRTIKQFEESFRRWVGYTYYVWYDYKNEKAYVTWLYNDHNNNIIFEITPSYPYFFCDIKKQRYFVPYKQWIKNYKPYFKTHLSRETAQQWYEQADHFVKTVDDNSARWKKECEEKTCETCSKREQRKK